VPQQREEGYDAGRRPGRMEDGGKGQPDPGTSQEFTILDMDCKVGGSGKK